MTNPLVAMQRLGQSPWHDNIRRGLLTSGELARMVADGDITGLTSNPTIFEQAIAQSDDYDEAIDVLASRGKNPDQIFDTLAIEDIRNAADVFTGVYARTGGVDGYVSIEVKPTLANDTAGTIAEAHRLWKAVDRPNLMVKIPATPAGVPAIQRCIADGLNINVTLIFALERYDEVMEAYLAGLEQRAARGLPIDRIASVASFFVSRVDTAVDKVLESKLATALPDQAAQLRQLQGKSAIANAKLAYAEFRRKFDGPRFQALAAKGARVQRPLWASTSTKNPAYPDVYYVEALIGPDTVDTMPPATIKAYKDHGKPEPRLAEGLDEAAALLKRLEDAGVSMDAVTQKLEEDGVASFAKSFESLLATVATAVAAVKAKAAAAPAPAAKPAATKAVRKPVKKAPRRKPAAKKAAPKRKAARKVARKTARKPAARTTARRKPAARKPAARKPAARKTKGKARATAKRKVTARTPAKRMTSGRKVTARKAGARKPRARKPAARRVTTRRRTRR